MNVRMGVPRLVGLIALALASWGCGDGRPSVDTSTAEGTVKGKVTVRGKPAAKGMISFDPSNVARKDAAPRNAEIGPDGSYSVTTLVGANRVFFSGPPFTKEPRLQDAEVRFDVQAGENTLDVRLPEDAGGP